MTRRTRRTSAGGRERLIALLLGCLLLAATTYESVSRLLLFFGVAVLVGFLVVWTLRNLSARPSNEPRGFEVQLRDDQTRQPK